MSMRKNIMLNQVATCMTGQKYNATSKARADVIRTLVNRGYEDVTIISKNYSVPLLTSALKVVTFIRFAWKYRKQNVIIQYPASCENTIELNFSILKMAGVRITLLIHDIQSFRENSNPSKEIRVLNMADMLLVHTPSMKRLLEDYGVKTKMVVMNIFDYYASDEMPAIEEIIPLKQVVLFAGNLAKSKFLPSLVRFADSLKNVSFRFYGKGWDESLDGHVNSEYMGAFLPEKTASLKGGWGLVWDGDSIEKCSGDMGNYLRWNAPHKLSLYLAAGIPVIVWRESAVAPWVQENGIGIVVNGLNAVQDEVTKMTDEEYDALLRNVRVVGSRLREGYYLTKVVNGLD